MFFRECFVINSLCFILFGFLLSGCIGDLDTQSRVHDLRILAIQATPPEKYIMEGDLNFHLEVLAPLGVDDAAKISDNNTSQDVVRNYRVSTCPAPEDGRCEGREGELVLGTGAYAGDGFGLDFSFGPEHALLLKDAIEADPWHGFGGLPVTIAVKIWIPGQRSPAEFGYKQIVFQLPGGLSLDGEPPNENPPPPILTDGAKTPLSTDAPLVISGNKFRLDIDPALQNERPHYNVPTYSGGQLSLRESWTYEWFSTRGKFDPESTGGNNPVSGAPMSSFTDLILDKDDGDVPGPFVLWCVLRDGRGGTSWTKVEGEFLDDKTDDSKSNE